jgi:hypothetical protein
MLPVKELLRSTGAGSWFITLLSFIFFVGWGSNPLLLNAGFYF